MNKINIKTLIIYNALMCYCLSSYANVARHVMPPIPEQLQINNYSRQQIISNILLGEIAISRGEPSLAVEYYLQAAKQTQDVKLAEIATQAAIDSKSMQHALIASSLWADLAKEQLHPQMVATALSLSIDQKKAMVYIKRAFAINSENIDLQLLNLLPKLPPTSVNSLNEILLSLTEENPQDAIYYLTAAQIIAHQANKEAAYDLIEKTLQLNPSLTRAITLNAKLILHKTNSTESALSYLNQQIKRYPKNHHISLFYASALIDNKQHTDAIPILNKLYKLAEYKGQAGILISNIYMEQNELAKAKQILYETATLADYSSQSAYMLGQIYENLKHLTQAIEWYQKVDETSQYHSNAYIKAATLAASQQEYNKAIDIIIAAKPQTIIEQKQIILTEVDILTSAKQYDKAIRIINQTLNMLPNDIDLLYARSYLSNLEKNTILAEQDLRIILNIDPNHANALNALGYTLSTNPNRYIEAKQYLERALELFPNHPAFMDSMGVLLFKMGQIDKAKIILENAYKISEDAEIATHLGEVLWHQGKYQQATKLWQEALSKNPHNHELIEMMKKYQLKGK